MRFLLRLKSAQYPMKQNKTKKRKEEINVENAEELYESSIKQNVEKPIDTLVILTKLDLYTCFA